MARRLCLDERVRIEAMAQAGYCSAEIARMLGRHRSTIRRELARGGGPHRYRAAGAQRSADVRAARPKAYKLAGDADLASAVQERLGRRWSPHAVSADLRRQGLWVCAETVYRACYANSASTGLEPGSWEKLPRQRRRRPRGRLEQARRSALGRYRPLADRPAAAGDRAEPGCWEGDLVVGRANRSAVATLVEHTSRCALAVPLADGCVEAIRSVAVARRSAVKARTVAANQVHALALTAPERLQGPLRGLAARDLIEVCARLRPSAHSKPAASAAALALRSVARRHRALTAETAELDRELLGLCEQANPALSGACGVGAEVASSLLIAAGDNPERMRSEAASAARRGASPIEASSGATTRHRLNRGGNRQANNALWRIAMIRLRIDQKSIDCAARRAAEGKTRRETLRCLKRHIAREICKLLTDPPQTPRGADLRQQRTRSGLTTAAVAAALNTPPTRISELERGLHHNSDLAHRYQQHLDQTPNRQT